jgi:hypothetical protein
MCRPRGKRHPGLDKDSVPVLAHVARKDREGCMTAQVGAVQKALKDAV